MLKCVFVINNLTIQIYNVFYYLPNYFMFFFKIFFSPDLISAALSMLCGRINAAQTSATVQR
jgi:hypothetical protein